MLPSARRLLHRWRTACRFASLARSVRDVPGLFLAGVARERPFGDNSLYSRLGRRLAGQTCVGLRAPANARLHLDLREATDLMILEEVFLDGIYPLERVPFEPDQIVDCGACAGFFTLLAHGRHPNVPLHLFEPVSGNVARTRANLALNGIMACIHAAAVGHREGVAPFRGAGFGGRLTAGNEAGDSEVRVMDLVDYVRTLRSRRLLLKMDIEGTEQTLLPALLPVLPASTTLFLETHQPRPVWQDYLQPFAAAGFRHDEIRCRRDPERSTEYTEHILWRHAS